MPAPNDPYSDQPFDPRYAIDPDTGKPRVQGKDPLSDPSPRFVNGCTFVLLAVATFGGLYILLPKLLKQLLDL